MKEMWNGRIHITPEMRSAVMERDLYLCRYCGRHTGPFTMDHVIPVSRGGKTVIGNLVTCCRPCNTKKNDDQWEPKPIGYRKVKLPSPLDPEAPALAAAPIEP